MAEKSNDGSTFDVPRECRKGGGVHSSDLFVGQRGVPLASERGYLFSEALLIKEKRKKTFFFTTILDTCNPTTELGKILDRKRNLGGVEGEKENQIIDRNQQPATRR